MTPYQQKKLEEELKQFASKNFEKPSDCKNCDQIRFYVQELCNKIEEYKNQFNYVPNWAYGLLAQYNARQNDMIHVQHKNTYH